MTARAAPGRAGSRLAPGEEGVSAVEFALVVPVLLLVLSGVVDVSRLLLYQSDLTQAVRSGAQYLLGNPTAPQNAAGIVKAATRLGTEASFASDSSQCACAATSIGPLSWSACSGLVCPPSPVRRYVKVSATYAWTPIFGSMSFLPPTAAASLQVRVQ